MKKLLPIFLLLITFTNCVKTADYSYKVTGSGGPFDITYTNSSDGTSQLTASDGWTYSWTEKPSERFRYISAQCNKTGSVKVDIIKNGAVVKTSSSNGAYVIASCSIP